MGNLLQLNYDIRPFPKEERRRGSLPAVVEAGVIQELQLMNSIYENVQESILTTEQALDIMWMLENTDSLLDESVDIMQTEESDSYREILEKCIILDLPISGTGVLSKTIIYESGKPDSIYKGQNWTRMFATGSDSLTTAMNRRMDYLETELHRYFESYGERGFDNDASTLYLENFDPETGLTLKEYLETVALAATITDRISAEDGVAIISFLESALMEEIAIPAMKPITVPGEGEVLTKNPIKDPEAPSPSEDPMVLEKRPENAKVTEGVANLLLNTNGWYSMEAAMVYKNNTIFDSISKKLYGKISKFLKLSIPDDANASFAAGLNMHKDAYRFYFKDVENEEELGNIENTVRAAILSSGFKPIKTDKRVVNYTMDRPPITITVEFDSIQLGLGIEYTTQATTESVEEETKSPIISLALDNSMNDKLMAIFESLEIKDQYMTESVDYIENTSMYDKLKQIKQNWGELIHVNEAVDTLMAILEKGEDIENNEAANKAMNMISIVSFVETACKAVCDKAEAVMEASKEDIDPRMKPIIELLNRLGYGTKYSSAGHREERSKDDRDKNGVYYGKLYTTARLTFDGNYKFDELPKGWYQNYNSDKTAIYVKPLSYNDKEGDPDKAFSKWRDEYMDSLKTWAENLKEAKETKKEEDKEDSKE